MRITGVNKMSLALCPAVFIDRDGVLNDMVERGPSFWVYGKKVARTAPFSYAEFRLKDWVKEALEIISQAGFLRILASNQPDIAYGTLPQSENERIMSAISALPLDDIFLCLHGRNDGCSCKKPKPGLLIQAAQKWGISLKDSFIVGDGEADMEAGRLAGCRTILIRTNYNSAVICDYSVDSLLDAAIFIRSLKGE